MLLQKINQQQAGVIWMNAKHSYCYHQKADYFVLSLVFLSFHRHIVCFKYLQMCLMSWHGQKTYYFLLSVTLQQL